MSIIGNEALAGASGQAGYFIDRSLRFRSSASAYLSRTPASSSNSQKFTISFWMKYTIIGSDKAIFGTNNGGTAGFRVATLNGANSEFSVDQVNGSNGLDYRLWTSMAIRDPASWYHIVISFDTTQATASNRIKMYINGVQVTSFITASYPSQNLNTYVNASTNPVNIGRQANATAYFDGYLTEFNFVDGQQLDASYFGETDLDTGVWKPKKYAGTYGTNGFYLNFKNPATTVTLCADQSGNGNNWGANNISLSAGSTYDSMQDVPTLTSEDAGNYATWNPIGAGPNISVSDGNLYAFSSTNSVKNIGGTLAVNSGKWYYEMTVTALSDPLRLNSGFSNPDVSQYEYIEQVPGLKWSHNAGNNTLTFLRMTDYSNSPSTVLSVSDSLSAGQTYIVAYDAATGKIWVGKNGTWYNSGNPAAGTGQITTLTTSYVYTPAAHLNSTGSGNGVTLNCGQRPFTYTPPSGFKALNTYNLPTPTIKDGEDYFNTKLFTGNNSTQSITGMGFQPDFVWFKNRSGANNHALYDAVRGRALSLISNALNSDITSSAGNDLVSFDSDGFSVGPVQNHTSVNGSGASIVTWNWKANGSGVSNTDGSITSTVSANTTSGFSIISYQGNSTSGATIGHGLGIAPSMFFVKSRDQARGWNVYHIVMGNTKYVQLQNTNAPVTNSAWWNNTSPSSSVITLGNDPDVNGSTQNYICYAFAPIEGYSAFGSYPGNGSNDGAFVYTGFRPAMVFYRTSNYISNIAINDSARDPYNVIDTVMYTNSSGADDTNASQLGVDYLSNGFKIRGVNGTINNNGYIQMYAAFAENPFKYSLAR